MGSSTSSSPSYRTSHCNSRDKLVATSVSVVIQARDVVISSIIILEIVKVILQ